MTAVTDKNTAIVVLAAGMSRRMGSDNKLLLCAGDQSAPMLRSVAEQALGSAASTVYIVLGHQSAAVRNSLNGLPLCFIYNDNYQDGLSESVKSAISEIDERHTSLIIALGDMPFVTSSLFNLLIENFSNSNNQPIVAPRFNHQRGNPVLWPKRYFSALKQVKGDKGGRQLLQQHQAEILLVDVTDQSVCMDIDNHEQLTASYS